MTDSAEVAGMLDRPEDAGKGPPGIVHRWQLEWDLASKTEKTWREEKAKAVVERYRDEEKGRSANRFNVLYANTEIMRPSLYNSLPKPDVRRRFRDKDPVGKHTADVLERALTFQIDSYDFDATINAALLDYLLPGRAVSRVRFEPKFQTVTPKQEGAKPYEQLTYAEIKCEPVDWRCFRRGPGRNWPEVQWIGFEHYLTRAEAGEKFGPELAKRLELDYTPDDAPDAKTDQEKEIWSRATVREIWSKEDRKVYYIAPSIKEQPVKVEDDPLELRDFFPVPRPLYAVDSTDTLVPVEEYRMYKDQADELDRITKRINKIISALRVRGIYDATLKELDQLFRADDNAMIPAADGLAVMSAGTGGGFDKAIWMMPIERLAQVLKELYLNRESIKQTIYEITGLSDILRGASNANETLGAQKLKAQTGSLRLQRRQREVQRYIRDIIRIKAEIIAENFTPEMLATMTGVNLPFAEQKKQAQQLLQMAQQGPPMGPDGQPAQIPPQIQAQLEQAQQIASLPSWEEVMQVLKSDAMREFRVDIETDSTVAADQALDREQIVEAFDAVTRGAAAFGPAVQMGIIPPEPVLALMQSVMRRFKFGRQVEDALDKMLEGAKEGNIQPPPNPEAQKAEAENKKAERDGQMAERQHAMEMEKMQATQQMERERHGMEKERMDMTAQHERRSANLKMTMEGNKHVMGMAQARAKAGAQGQPAEGEADMPDLIEMIQTAAQTAEETRQQIAQLSQTVQQLVPAVSALVEQASAPVELVRGQGGQATHVRKGKTVRPIKRGPDGRAIGLQ